MKVDFKKITVTNVQGNPVPFNMAQQIGELLYNTTNTLASLELARRIYNSDGEIEMTVTEWSEVKNCVENNTTARVRMAFNEYEKTLKID